MRQIVRIEIMKILMVLERDFPPDLRVENEINSLQEGGHQIFLACYTFRKEYIQEEWNNCKVFKKPISSLIYKSSVGALKFPIYFKFWRSFVLDLCEKIQPDVIHIHDLPLATIGVNVKQKIGIKFVLDLHENWPAFLKISKHAQTFLGKLLSSDRQWREYEIDMCSKADSIIVVIEEARERLTNLGIPIDKIQVVANYPVLSDFDEIKLKDKNSDRVIFYYAGGIGEHRGLQYIIKGFSLLKEQYPGITLWIFGQGNYRNTLERMVAELNLQSEVIFFGQVSYNEVLKKLMEADIALVPHEKSEHTDTTIPHKIFQYMYAQKAVIASDCKPLTRVLQESHAGISYQYDSPDNFAEAALIFLNSEATRNKFGRNGKKAVENKFNWVKEQEKLKLIYQ